MSDLVSSSQSAVGRRVAGAAELLRAIGPVDTLRRIRQELELRGSSRASGDSYGRIWRDAAQALDARVVEVGDGFLEISRGDRRTRVRGRFTALDGEVTLRLVRDKAALNRMLLASGVRMPEQVELDREDLRGAREFMARCEPPWVVKPAGASGGQGVTTGLYTFADFERARRRATLDGSGLLLERQVMGDVHRMLLLDGELLDVLRRFPSSVIGDGHCTVGELIDAENRSRRASPVGASLLFIDLECVLTLSAQHLSLTSVPAPGRAVELKRVTNQNGPRDNHTVHTPPSPEVLAQARHAARTAGLRLAGIDVLTTDIARPLVDTGGAVLEVNGAPGLHYHYSVADRAGATPVAIPILRALLSSAD